MKFGEWFSIRGPDFVLQRAEHLFSRYGFLPDQAINRINVLVEVLVQNGCLPTFPTPAVVVQRHREYFRELQQAGVEIAVHGNQHVNLKAYPVDDACRQLITALETFEQNGINVYGFRCPYLGCTEALVDKFPRGLFEYSSNQIVQWEFPPEIKRRSGNSISDTLRLLYSSGSYANSISIPHMRTNMLEIPIYMPDDMLLIDGLDCSPDEMAEILCQMLQTIYQRGEIFTLIFHPELIIQCEQPLLELLSRAKHLQPPVWITRLHDISSWWSEKAGFGLQVSTTNGGLNLAFHCTQRATILFKGLDSNGGGYPWDGVYYRLRGYSLNVPVYPRPFIGLPASAPQNIVSFLREQGYILDQSETASTCGIYLDHSMLGASPGHARLIEHIENAPVPLVRYGRWPEGARCALSITGDLDALSLLDYATRLFGY